MPVWKNSSTKMAMTRSQSRKSSALAFDVRPTALLHETSHRYRDGGIVAHRPAASQQLQWPPAPPAGRAEFQRPMRANSASFKRRLSRSTTPLRSD